MFMEMSGKRSHCCHKTRAHSRYKSTAKTELDTKTERGWQKPGKSRSRTDDRSSAGTLSGRLSDAHKYCGDKHARRPGGDISLPVNCLMCYGYQIALIPQDLSSVWVLSC